MARWRSTMAPPSARTAVSPLAVATGCFSAAIRAAKRLRCCEASSRLATAAVLSPSPGSATCCPEFRRTPSRGLVNYCPTAGNRSLVQPRSELRLYHSIHATGMRFTSRLPLTSVGAESEHPLEERPLFQTRGVLGKVHVNPSANSILFQARFLLARILLQREQPLENTARSFRRAHIRLLERRLGFW